MSIKDQAFELFEQGKQLGDPELTALGVKRDTLKKYYYAWKKTKEAPEPTTEPTPKRTPKPASKEAVVSSLATLQPFIYDSRQYTKRRTVAGMVVGLSKKGDKLIRLPEDTLVIPME